LPKIYSKEKTNHGAIAQLLASPDLREKMGQNGKQLVRDRYSWEVIAQELIKNYSAIIQQANR